MTIKKAVIRSKHVRALDGALRELVHPITNDIWEYSEKEWEKRLVVTNENDCWDWLGAYHRQGYGMFSFRRSGSNRRSDMITIQRLSAAIDLNRPLLAKEFVLLKCENGSCCNPNHLKVDQQSVVQSEMKHSRLPRKYSLQFYTDNRDFILHSDCSKVASQFNLTKEQASNLKRMTVLRVKRGDL